MDRQREPILGRAVLQTVGIGWPVKAACFVAFGAVMWTIKTVYHWIGTELGVEAELVAGIPLAIFCVVYAIRKDRQRGIY